MGTGRGKLDVSVHITREEMLRRLAILVMQQNLFPMYNIFAQKKGQILHAVLLNICIGMQAQYHHLPHGDT